MYTDPSGYTWWSHFWGWTGEAIEKVGTAALKIDALALTILPSGIDALAHWNASRLDPFLKGTISNNDFQITAGLFDADTKQHGWGWQIVSRFTWQLPQTIVGYGISEGYDNIGLVHEVYHYDGATILRDYAGDWGAFTVGSFINGDGSIRPDPYNPLFQHEYGHYLQSQIFGPGFLPLIAIPSLINAAFNNQDVHKLAWYEEDANARAITFWKSTIPNYDMSQWDPSNSPANYVTRQSLHWYDFLCLFLF